MNAPLVSVVMSVFNGGHHLDAAVESILGQSYQNFELIIIDDGSSDRSVEVLAAYSKRDRRVQVHRQENRGLVASLCRGCDLANGIYLARMDADDIAITDRLAWQVAFMEDHPEVGVLGGAAEFIDAKGRSVSIARHPCDSAEIRRELLDRNVLWHPSVMMRKASYLQVGGYRNVSDAEDYDLWLRMAEVCEVANLHRIILRYRIHPQQGSVQRSKKQALGTLIAQTSARARLDGEVDPFDPSAAEPWKVLSSRGVSDERIQGAVARAYLSCLRNMYYCGEYKHAAEIFQSLSGPECARADKWIRSDACLWMAKVYGSNGEYHKCVARVWQALMIRPAILGRPLKPVAQWFGRLSVQN